MDMEYYKQYEPIFGSWRITRLIGEGSFGKVFEIEREDFGVTYKAALKAITVPAHHFPTCRDVLVQCIKFVLPEDLDVSGGSPFALCNTRNFKVRVIAHNIDSDFACCNGTIV